MKDKIKNLLEESIAVKKDLIDDNLDQIERAIKAIIKTYQAGGKVILFGNGGSAADAQHLVAEMVGRFAIERRSLPAIALNCNNSITTALANDYGYESIFSRQIQAYAEQKDSVIGISTSGNSKNVLLAIKEAKKIGAITIGFSGETGELNKIVDITIAVRSKIVPRIQEAHITVGHIICQLIEEELFKNL